MKHPPRRGPLPFVLALLSATATLGSCHSGSPTIVEGPEYPTGLQRGPTLNVQVFRRATEIEFTNTSDQPIPPSTMWLNAWYAHHIDGLGVGQTMTLPLSAFKDRFGDPFRGGGFFATEIPERLALAEVQTDGKMIGLIVVGGEGQP